MKNFQISEPSRNRSLLFSIIVLINVILIIYYVYWEGSEVNQMVKGEASQKSNNNYFKDAERVQKIGLILNTSSCQIPNFDPWDVAILPFVSNSTLGKDCRKSSFNWTRMENTDELVFNAEQMMVDGYPFKNTTCCFKIVRRVQQALGHHDWDSDNLNSYSSCTPILEMKTKISAEFIMVQCVQSRFADIVYRGFHASAQSNSSSTIESKIRHWKKIEDRPPNIFVVGIDSLSRLNFRRNMPKTRKFLDNLGAVEMLGYTKVGEATVPNLSAVLNGYVNSDLNRICFSSTSNLFNCPTWIWKRLDSANYLTAFTEDAPTSAIFNSWGNGFVQQPVDFYGRPIFIAAHAQGNVSLKMVKKDWNKRIQCIGHQSNDDVITAYLESVMDIAVTKNAPVFSLSWSTTNSHDNPNAVQLVDENYAQLFQRLTDKGYLNNTIVVFMGDHGYRYGPWRETLIGYYEDKLPNFWISLPSWIREKFPQWQKALEINSKELTSPFTFYWTLQLILDTFTNTSSQKDGVDRKSKKSIPRKHKQNFFESGPKVKTCDDVGVPDTYCACYPVQMVDLNDPILRDAALSATNVVNNELTKNIQGNKCTPLRLNKITAGAVKRILGKWKYIVRFETTPGDFLFEAEVNYFTNNQTFENIPTAIQRVNKINSVDVACLTDQKLQLFCYCRPFLVKFGLI